MKKFTIVGFKERTKDENRSLVAFTALNAFHQSTLQKIKGTLFRNVFKGDVPTLVLDTYINIYKFMLVVIRTTVSTAIYEVGY
jgi:hypothetical protein